MEGENPWGEAGKKQCAQCGAEKPLESFRGSGRARDGRRKRCKACEGPTSGPAGVGTLARADGGSFAVVPPEASAIPHFYQGLFQRQRGVCAICGQPETARDEDGSLLPLSLYGANHDGRRINGLVCKLCNMGLSMFRDSPVFLARAIEFLTKRQLALNVELRTHEQ